MNARFDAYTVELGGQNVVTASAGTGKTYAITVLVVRLIIERGLDIRHILVVTFTEAATSELRGRVRAKLVEAAEAYRRESAEDIADPGLRAYVSRRAETRGRDLSRLEDALANVDEAAISTIHGFCQRMLKDSAFESDVDYETELVTDLGPLRDQVVHDAWTSIVANQPENILERVLAEKLKPAGLRSLADRVAENPDLRILGGGAGLSEDEYLVARAKELWQTQQKEILEIFLARSRKQSRQATIDRWIAEVNAFFEDRTLIVGVPSGIRRFGGDDDQFDRPVEHPFFVACEHLRRLHGNRGSGVATPEIVELRRQVAEYVRAELPRRKQETGIFGFEDLLLRLKAALEGPNGTRLAEVVRSEYGAALIDEFQDTDPVQFAIFDAVYGSSMLPVFLIGDPKQAIYSFRGADVFAYFSAIGRPGLRHYTMGRNYRSDPRLLRAVDALFTERADWPPAFLLPGIDFPRVEPAEGAKDRFRPGFGISPAPLDVLFASDASGKPTSTGLRAAIPALVASDIVALLRSGSRIGEREVQPGDIAVLTRTNAQCMEIQSELRARNVPSVVLGDRSVFESREARELQAILGAIVEPSRVLLRRALATELLSVSANELARMEVEPAAWDAWAGRFRDWGRIWVERGFVQMLDALVTEAEVAERLLRLSDGDRRMTNLLHLMELLRTAAKESHLGPPGLLHFLAEQRGDAKRPAEHAEIRLESDEMAVKLTTIHKSKGLEYGIVYCPYPWDGWLLLKSDLAALRFHDPDDANRLKIDLGSERFQEHKEIAELEALAENVRLLYVAVTRARHRLTLVWAHQRGTSETALFTLLHPPPRTSDGTVSIRAFRSRPDLTMEEMIRPLAARALASEDALGMRCLPAEPTDTPLEFRGTKDAPLRLRTVQREFAGSWKLTSFSALAHGAEETPAADGGAKDHDEAIVVAPLEPTLVAPAEIVLSKFARGASAGVFYHSVLEHLDFQDDAAIEPMVRAKLVEAAYDPEAWTGVVSQSIRDVLATPLTHDALFRLKDVPQRARLNELEFHLPLADSPGEARVLLTGSALASVFSSAPSREVPAEYAARLERLRFAPVDGFLKGYVDLVLEHGGRFYVVDYKTNFLGAHPGAYDAKLLGDAMAHGHYFLQYHLYSLAVHRYLERRVPGYTYETHFGGSLYLFVRGMAPESGAARGVFFEKPPFARIEALSRLLDGDTGRKTA